MIKNIKERNIYKLSAVLQRKERLYCTIPNLLFCAVILRKYRSRRSKISGRRLAAAIHQMRIRLYDSGNPQKFSHVCRSFIKARRMEAGRTNLRSFLAWCSWNRCLIASKPAGVIRFALINLFTRSRFIADSWLPGLRGLNRCVNRNASTFLRILSIQPKQRASSTASL